MSDKYIVSIDVGGTKKLGAVLNTKKGIIHRIKISTPPPESGADIGEGIANLVTDLIAGSGVPADSIEAIVLGIPGSVDIENGIVGMAPNLKLVNYNVKEALLNKLDYPVLVENDVNLAALGSLHFGVAKGKQNVLVVFVGTGIGSGIILNGNIYRGRSFAAGEIGHINVGTKGPLCGCGKKGCFEAVASRTAIVRDIRNLILKGKKSVLREKAGKDKPIKSKALKDALESGDKLTEKVVTKACGTIGRVLAGINNLMNFDMIVLGGGMLEANEDIMMPKIIASFDKYSLESTGSVVEITGTSLRDDAPIYGGIALVKEFLNKDV